MAKHKITLDQIESLIDAVTHCAMAYAQNQYDPHCARRLTESQKNLMNDVKSMVQSNLPNSKVQHEN